MAEPEAIVGRHEGHHHTANIKYGYLIFGVSLAHMAGIMACHRFYSISWRKRNDGRSLVRLPLFITIVVWSLILLAVGVFHISFENYTTGVKRFGRMAYVLVPFDILLVLRPNVAAIQYLELVDLHKWMSRLIIGCAFMHGGGYFIKWILEGELLTKTFRLWNFLGVLVWLLCLSLVVISLRYFRRLSYQYFYIVHNVTMWLFIGLICLHARPGVGIYTIICAGLLATQIYKRFSNYHPVDNVKIVGNEGSNLIIVRIPKQEDLSEWPSGSHIRVTYPMTNYRAWLFPTHPYTIVSSPQDPSIDLIINKTNNFVLESHSSYSWIGPFPSLGDISASKLTIICGGSGISFALPIFKSLKQNISSLKLIWCVKTKSDIYILRALGFNEEIDVYVTGNLEESENSTTLFDEEDYGLLDYDNNENFELESLLSSESTQNPSNEDLQPHKPRQKEASKFSLHQGRPAFDTVFEPLLQSDNRSEAMIIACGPETLIRHSERWAGLHGVKFASEVYEM